MKKYLSIILLTLFLSAGIKAVAAPLTFDQAVEDKKPALVLITAPWASASQTAVANFNSLKNVYGDAANFVTLDIASEQARSYNSKYAFFPNIPYMMMFKSKAKIQLFVPQSCVLDNACISKKVGTFLH